MVPGGRGGRSLLVVGAGIPGAVVAWLASVAGFRVTLASLGRPGGRSTALHPGVVHGAGPPWPPARWPDLPREVLETAARRAREGRSLLHRFLLENDDPVGFRFLPSGVPLPGGGAIDPARLSARLAEAGFPVRLDGSVGGLPVLGRSRDALLVPRRLVFALLRSARDRGAEILLGSPVEGWRRGPGGGLVARVGGEERAFDHLAWTPDRPPPGTARQGRWRPAIVLFQERAEGPSPLGRILHGPGGGEVLAPHPARPGRVVLVRRSRVDPAGEVEWPPLPAAFQPFLGSARRQRLAEVFEGPADREFPGDERVAVLSGLAGWPVAAVFGLGADLLRSWGGSLPAPGGG